MWIGFIMRSMLGVEGLLVELDGRYQDAQADENVVG